MTQLTHPNRYSLLFINFTAILLGLAFPISAFLVNLALVLVIVCLLVHRPNWQQIQQTARQPLIYLPAILYLLLCLSQLFHHHPDGPKLLGKYVKLLYLLPLTLFFILHPNTIKKALLAFLSINGLILLISSWVGISHIALFHVNPAEPTVFKLHITQSFFIALAATIWLALAFQQTQLSKKLALLALVILSTINVLFLVSGRTGYLCIVVGIAIVLWQQLSKKQLAISIASLACVLALLLWIPNKATENMRKGLGEINQCQLHHNAQFNDSCDSSMGLRKSFITESIKMIKQAPIFGNGVGAFHYPIDQDNVAINPHNQYLLDTLQTGLIGLALLLTWFLCCFRRAWQQPQITKTLFVAVLSCYMVANLFNSFLLDSSESHLLITLIALLASLPLTQTNKKSP